MTKHTNLCLRVVRDRAARGNGTTVHNTTLSVVRNASRLAEWHKTTAARSGENVIRSWQR